MENEAAQLAPRGVPSLSFTVQFTLAVNACNTRAESGIFIIKFNKINQRPTKRLALIAPCRRIRSRYMTYNTVEKTATSIDITGSKQTPWQV